MFSVNEWEDVAFFDLVGGFQTFSLADPAPHQNRQQILLDDKDWDDYGQGTNSQKRQKVFDYSEYYCIFDSKSAKHLKEAITTVIHAGLRTKTTWGRLETEIRGLYARETLKEQARELEVAQKSFTHQFDRLPDHIRHQVETDILQSCIYHIAKTTWLYSNLGTMATSSDSQLFEDTFTVTSIDNSKYDRVARLGCSGTNNETVMTLDINTELFPCAINDALQCVLATTLSLDGSKEDKGWRDVGRAGPGGETTLADMFDYVCHGKLYKFEDGDDGVM
jgi:DNA-directed RNA polymerase I, II, and III subunit RPABC3